MAIVWQNIIFALGIKLLILVLAALGIANMWLAVFGDVGVAIIAILNAMRAMGVKNLQCLWSLRPGPGLVLKTSSTNEAPPFCSFGATNGGASGLRSVFKTKPGPGLR